MDISQKGVIMKTTVPAHNLPTDIDLLQIASLLYDYSTKVMTLEDENERLKQENKRLQELLGKEAE